MTRRQYQRGFTLVEMMFGILITSIVALALVGAFVVGYRTISLEAREVSADEAVSNASLGLVRDLTSATTLTTGTITPTCGCTLTMTYGSPVTTAIYRIDAKNNLTRSVGANTTVMARGLKSVAFSAGATACAYTVTLTPSASGAAAVTLGVTQRVGTTGCL